MIGALITLFEVYGALLVFLRRLRDRRRRRPFDWASDTLTDIRQLPERERWLA